MNPNYTFVFEFPISSPAGSISGKELPATNHLEIWKFFQEWWCEHKPSVTISVGEDEWPKVGAWVWSNFKWMSGVSFLPHSDHTYAQAPYEEIEEEAFQERQRNFPELDWSKLEEFEKEDSTTGTHALACTANECEIVDIGG